jgi:hypothetical protein
MDGLRIAPSPRNVGARVSAGFRRTIVLQTDDSWRREFRIANKEKQFA